MSQGICHVTAVDHRRHNRVHAKARELKGTGVHTTHYGYAGHAQPLAALRHARDHLAVSRLRIGVSLARDTEICAEKCPVKPHNIEDPVDARN